MPDITYSTLTQIITKVRRLTRTPSTTQISDAEIRNYINTFVLYDFPESLKAFSLRKTLTFYTRANIDKYETNTVDPNDPLYNFKNLYVSIHDPIYIGGKKAFFTESREQLFNIFPQNLSLVQLGLGNGVLAVQAGTLQAIPFARESVLFNTLDVINNQTMQVWDDGEGNLLGDCLPAGVIDYNTGVYNFTWTLAPANLAKINVQTLPFTSAQPTSICWFDDSFILRPIPDQAYAINLEVYKRPDELLALNQMPEISQWWQYIAYGAAKKIFEDRTDTDSIQAIYPELKRQEVLAMRRLIMKISNSRSSTIYTESTTFGTGLNSWGGW